MTKIDFSGITSDNIVTSDNKKYIREDDEIFNSLKDEIAACENAQVQTELATLEILDIKEQTKVIANEAIDTATERAETAAENAETAQALAETAAINALEAERNVTEFSETLAKLDEDNTFTGDNNFTGNLELNGKLLLNGKDIDSLISGHNIGEQWISMDGTIPDGGLAFLGQTVSKTTYYELYNWVETHNRFKTEAEWQSLYSANNGNVAFYAKVDDNTFRMPSFKGYLKANTTAGEYIKEGLPNITGQMRMSGIANASYGTGISHTSGAIVGCSGTDISLTATPSGIYAISGFDLNASKSNSIYGNSTHVTPETNTILVGVYAFNTIINPSNLDVESLRLDITSNAESLRHDITSNVESLRDDITSNVESLNRDISSKKGYVDYTTGVYAYGSITGYLGDSENIKYFTAPYDCFIVLQLKFKNALASYTAPGIWVSVNDVNIAYPMITDVTGYTAVIPLYLKSGDKLGVDARYNSGTFTKLSSLCYYKWN